jgi:hypothetical protein
MLSLKFARTLHLAETSRGRCWKREQSKFLSGGKEEDLAAEELLSFLLSLLLSFVDFCGLQVY